MYGLDLFSGIGGLTRALEGYVQPVAYCERDAYARQVLLSNMRKGLLPLAPIHDNVCNLREVDLPLKVDIIYGGFPCQDISNNGRGRGLEGERSRLFFEILRLADEIKPTFVFLENVPAIRTKGLSRVVRELADRGYDSRWTTVSAKEIGAPHYRNRWFLLAYTNRKSQQRLSGGKTKEFPRLGTDGKPCGGYDWWKIEPGLGRMADGIPDRVDRLKCLGNAVVPLQAREAFERLSGLKVSSFNGYSKQL